MANTITAIGAPGSLMRRFQEQPQLGVDLLAASERLYREVAKLPGDMYDERDELRKAWEEIGRVIRAAGGSTGKAVPQ